MINKQFHNYTIKQLHYSQHEPTAYSLKPKAKKESTHAVVYA